MLCGLINYIIGEPNSDTVVVEDNEFDSDGGGGMIKDLSKANFFLAFDKSLIINWLSPNLV